MKKTVAFLFTVFVFAGSALAQNNSVVFDNQSGEPALVKLIGPTSTELDVANGSKGVVAASAGRYQIKIRYGVPGKFRYAKGEEFNVTETATTRSETIITLHKVVGGNYETQDISEKDFGDVVVNRKTDIPSPRPKAVETPKGILGEYITAGPWQMRVLSFQTFESFAFQSPTGAPEKVEVKPRDPKTKVAIVTVLLTPTRPYTAKEREHLEESAFHKMALGFAKIFDADKILTTSDFYLGYLVSDQTQTLKLHACHVLLADKGSRSCVSIKNEGPEAVSANNYALAVKDEEVVARLVFSDWPLEQKAILVFWPFTDAAHMVIATIASGKPDGALQVQYGNIGDIKKLAAKQLPVSSR